MSLKWSSVSHCIQLCTQPKVWKGDIEQSVLQITVLCCWIMHVCVQTRDNVKKMWWQDEICANSASLTIISQDLTRKDMQMRTIDFSFSKYSNCADWYAQTKPTCCEVLTSSIVLQMRTVDVEMFVCVVKQWWNSLNLENCNRVTMTIPGTVCGHDMVHAPTHHMYNCHQHLTKL